MTTTTDDAGDAGTPADETRPTDRQAADGPTAGPRVPVPETDLSGVEEVVRCPYCERPFRTDRQRTLHVGEDHEEVCTDAERAAYERAARQEADELFTFHMKVVVALGLLYATFVISYTAVVGALG